MKLRKLLALLLVVVMTASLFAACGAKKGDDRSAYPGTAEDNSITVNITSEPPQMFTVKTTDTTSFTVIRHIIENLVMLDANDKVIPGVAKDWKISDDGLVYTFNLREGMKWSNGEPVTAHDFVFGWKSLLDPAFAAPYASFGYIFKNGRAFNEGTAKAEDVGFKAVSDYVLEVTLENPTAYALDTFAFGVFAPLNEKAYNQFGDAYATDADKIVTNGAFKMVSWAHEDKIVLEKNPDFYDAKKVNLQKINMVMIKDSNAAMNSFKAGEIDIINLTGEQSAMMKGEGFPVYPYDDGSCFYLEYNLTDEFVKNASLRKAITYAIDKKAFVDNIVKNSSKAAVGYTAPAINGLNKKFAEEVGALVPNLDVAKAKEFLATAKKELGTEDIKITMICDDTDVAMKYAAYVQEQLKTNLSLDIEVASMPFKSRLERMENKDFSIVYGGWGPDYNDPMTFIDVFETGNGNNHTSYSNPAYDELINKARTEADRKTRFGYLMDAEKLLMNDQPIGPIYWRARDYIVSGKIASGYIRTAFQDMNYKYVKLSK